MERICIMAKAKKIPDTITKKYFTKKVGKLPIDDDLERCNCQDAGKVGHFYCGWCKKCDLPIFICGHLTASDKTITLS